MDNDKIRKLKKIFAENDLSLGKIIWTNNDKLKIVERAYLSMPGEDNPFDEWKIRQVLQPSTNKEIIKQYICIASGQRQYGGTLKMRIGGQWLFCNHKTWEQIEVNVQFS